MVKINAILMEVFGFESGRDWEVGKNGEVVGFPVRLLIEVGRKNGLKFLGFKDGVYLYEVMNKDEVIEVKVMEKSRRLELEFEYEGERLRFIENV